jgi:hypothetical protein
MTFLEMQQEVARDARMQMDNATHVANIKFWLNRGQEDVGAAHSWWFLSHEFEQTLTAADRSYAFPNTDVDSATADLESIDIESMRTSASPLTFVWPSQLDRDDPNWTDSALAGTGSPRWWTVVRETIMLSHFPSTTFVTSYPKLYFRGFVRMADLSANTDVSVIPLQYHQVMVQGAKWRAYERQGVDDWRVARELFKDMLNDMIVRCRPVRGRARRIPAAPIFRLSGRRGANVTN